LPHDGNLADRPEHAQRLVTVKVGQAEIEYHQIRREVDDELQRLHGRRRARDGVPAVGERTDHRTADCRVILHEQQLCHAKKVSAAAGSPSTIEPSSVLKAAVVGRRSGKRSRR
jgi:hypothetical protein